MKEANAVHSTIATISITTTTSNIRGLSNEDGYTVGKSQTQCQSSSRCCFENELVLK